MGKGSQLMGYAKWWLLSKMGRKSPLVDTVVLFYRCNLRCRHCAIADTLAAHPERDITVSFENAVKELKARYEEGARIAYFEGGETTLWQDGDKDLGSLIDAAHEIGYYNVGYTTNGTTGRIYTNSDVISVSLDGPKEVHDLIRGEGVYDKLMETLANLKFSGSVYANCVLQRDNLDRIEETAKVVKDNPRLTGIIFNFLTPPPYEITPNAEERKKAVEEIERLMKEGYPILNSKKGLKLLAEEDWDSRCPRYISSFALPDGSQKFGCPSTGTDSCKHCGYAAVREYYLIGRGNLGTIAELSSVFAMGKEKSDDE